MRHNTRKSDSSLRIAFIFFASIALLIAGGFLLKLFLVLRASAFDGVHQYILEVDENHQKGALIAFNPANSSVTLLHVAGRADNGLGQYLDVPVDGSVEMQLPSNPSEITSHLLFAAKDEKGITIIDKLRLLIFANSLKPADFHEQSITLPVDTIVTEKLLPSLFQDATLYADNESVAIINATGESGVGSVVARKLTVIGINVVSVTTGIQDHEDTTISAAQTNNYTVHRLERLFHVSATTSLKAGISEVTITIGKKSLSSIE